MLVGPALQINSTDKKQIHNPKNQNHKHQNKPVVV